MDEVIESVGLYVVCGHPSDCKNTGFVKPRSDYGGWYKSKLLRNHPRKRWFCPEHAEDGRGTDRRFYRLKATTFTNTEDEKPKTVEEELYNLLD